MIRLAGLLGSPPDVRIDLKEFHHAENDLCILFGADAGRLRRF